MSDARNESNEAEQPASGDLTLDAPNTSGPSPAHSASKATVSPLPGKKMAGQAATAALGATSEKAGKAVETVQKVRALSALATKAVAATKSGIAAVVFILADPVFWIIIGVAVVAAVLILATLSAIQVVGRNQNANGCYATKSSGGTSGIQAKDSGDWIENANSVANWLMTTKFDFLGGKSMSLNQAAGIIGNWSQESRVNPKSTQSNFISGDADNSEVAAVTGGGRALGLAQWDSDRRHKLVEFAQSKGKKWNDINLQLEYFKSELEGYEGAQLVAGGFNDSSKSAEDQVRIFEEKFERAGIPALENRFAGARTFLANYKGGYTGGENSGGSCLMGNKDSTANLNTSNVVQLAVSMAYPTADQSRVTPDDPYGVSKAKPEYKAAKKKAMDSTGADPMPTLYASCDRFVATVSRLTMDKKLPWGSTIEQGQYLASSSKWKQYTKKSEAKPGDIWVTKTGGHIILYIGDHKGKDSIVHASYLDRVAGIDMASYLNNDLVDQGGRPYYGYHYVG